MKCRFCDKEFDDFVELNEHELECWNAKCELERRQREQEEIARRKAEEEKRLHDEINQRGKELVDLRNQYVVEWNRFKKDFEHSKWFGEWKGMAIDEGEIKLDNSAKMSKTKCNDEIARTRIAGDQIEVLRDVFPYCWFM